MTKNDILDFWFGPLSGPEDFPPDRLSMWFVKDPKTDQKILQQFGFLFEKNLEDWSIDSRGRLAHIIVLDQFSRNIYRNTSQAFQFDPEALSLTLKGMQLEVDKDLFPVERGFFYMPLQHSEDLTIQDQSITAYSQLVEEAPEKVKEQCRGFLSSAEKHRAIIARFGRYPHRNMILGRLSTSEELDFLKQPGSSF